MNNVRFHRTGERCGSCALCMWCNTAKVFSGGVHRTTQHCSSRKPPHQCTMISCMKAEYFRLAKEVAAIYALLREGMHEKGVDMGLTSTQAWANTSVGQLVWTICSASITLQQEHPAYHDKMNNVRFHSTGEICGSCALCMWCNTAKVFIGGP